DSSCALVVASVNMNSTSPYFKMDGYGRVSSHTFQSSGGPKTLSSWILVMPSQIWPAWINRTTGSSFRIIFILTHLSYRSDYLFQFSDSLDCSSISAQAQVLEGPNGCLKQGGSKFGVSKGLLGSLNRRACVLGL